VRFAIGGALTSKPAPQPLPQAREGVTTTMRLMSSCTSPQEHEGWHKKKSVTTRAKHTPHFAQPSQVIVQMFNYIKTVTRSNEPSS